MELNTSKIKAENKIIEFSTISRDITERKKTEHEIKESEEIDIYKNNLIDKCKENLQDVRNNGGTNGATKNVEK